MFFLTVQTTGKAELKAATDSLSSVRSWLVFPVFGFVLCLSCSCCLKCCNLFATCIVVALQGSLVTGLLLFIGHRISV